MCCGYLCNMSFLFLSLLQISLLIIIIYWGWFRYSINKVVNCKIQSNQHPGVSVIVAYKNAEQHLKSTLMAILNQDYPEFEVIAIDDFSTDNSMDIVSEISDIRLVSLKATKDLPGKKNALTEAILAAKYDILLFTDADCIPASNQWIKSMSANLSVTKNTEIVLGYGPMIKNQGCLNVFARYETILTAIQYMTYATSGIPYMGVGRNLMYRKTIFERSGGYTDHLHIASGDDDLLVSKAATQYNTVVNLDKESFVFSEAKDTLTSYLQQKTRHISTAYHYTYKHQFLLSLFAISQLSFYLILAIGYIFEYWTLNFVLAILFSKWIIQIFLHNDSFELLDGKDIRWWFPLLDISMTIYYIIIPFFGWFRKSGW